LIPGNAGLLSAASSTSSHRREEVGHFTPYRHLSVQVFTDRISAARAVIIFSFVDWL